MTGLTHSFHGIASAVGLKEVCNILAQAVLGEAAQQFAHIKGSLDLLTLVPHPFEESLRGGQNELSFGEFMLQDCLVGADLIGESIQFSHSI